MDTYPFGLDSDLLGYARLLRKRRMGKVSFWTVRFQQQIVQLILAAHALDNYDVLSKTAAGSSIWFTGITGLSSSGEFSVHCSSLEVVAPCARPLPSKHERMQSSKRYSDRLTGLLAESASFDLFRRITRGTREIRKFLWSQGFDEFSTGVLQQQREAGTAKPFTTYCNANGREYTLGLTSELKLRKLQVAGFENVFEILQSFRNEGMDSLHSPEFTLLEVCRIGADCEEMLQLLESMLSVVMTEIGPVLSSKDSTGPFTRVTFYDACQQILGIPRDECRLGTFVSKYPEQFVDDMGTFTWVFKVINKLLGPRFKDPTFITRIPSGISPLIKVNADDPLTTDRAALLIQGIDIADVYADENDPKLVREAMEYQFQEVGVPINEEYLRALEYGMPPSGSIGMGLNRLFMTMRGDLPSNIRETILYPL